MTLPRPSWRYSYRLVLAVSVRGFPLGLYVYVRDGPAAGFSCASRGRLLFVSQMRVLVAPAVGVMAQRESGLQEDRWPRRAGPARAWRPVRSGPSTRAAADAR